MPAGTAITIGNFDGVHRGHAALVRAARAAVGSAGQVIAASFEPHPLTVLKPEIKVFRLSTFEQRSAWLHEAGADQVVRFSPTREFLSQSPEQFIAAIVAQHHPQFIVEGADFHFGKARAGTVDSLRQLQSQHGYRSIIVDEVEAPLNDQSLVRVGSSLIRWLLEHPRGRVNDAASLLGRPYEIIARVVKGDRRGRELGVPTANLDHGDFVLPADGIYAGEAVRPDGLCFPAAISIGTKPTFGDLPRVCEAHLIGFGGPLDEYNWTIRLRFDRWLRDQLNFTGKEPLMAQLRRDIAAVAFDSTLCPTS